MSRTTTDHTVPTVPTDPTDPVIPPGGALGGGACTVGVTSETNTLGGVLVLCGLVLGLGRRSRRRSR